MTDLTCMYCLDSKFVPAGVYADLGEVYKACTACTQTCWACGGTSLFPANSRCRLCLASVYLPQGLQPVLCLVCDGIQFLLDIEAPTGVFHEHPN